jgi:hypothetical protein
VTIYVPLHVPEQHYDAMLEHLLSLQSGMTEARSTSAASAPSIEAKPDANMVVQERNNRFEAAWPDLRADQHHFFALLAERPGEYVPMEPDVATALGGSREAHNALISLTPRMKRNGFETWPIEVRRGEACVIYKMDDELARVVLRLWGESSS